MHAQMAEIVVIDGLLSLRKIPRHKTVASNFTQRPLKKDGAQLILKVNPLHRGCQLYIDNISSNTKVDKFFQQCPLKVVFEFHSDYAIFISTNFLNF